MHTRSLASGWRWSGSGPRLRCVQGCPWSGRGRHSRAAGKRPSTRDPRVRRILHRYYSTFYVYSDVSSPPPAAAASPNRLLLVRLSSSREQLHSNRVERERLLPPLLALQVLWNGDPPSSSSSFFVFLSRYPIYRFNYRVLIMRVRLIFDSTSYKSLEREFIMYHRKKLRSSNVYRDTARERRLSRGVKIALPFQ